MGIIDNTVKDKTLQNLLKFTVSGPAANNCIMRASGVTTKGAIAVESGGFAIASVLGSTALADGSVTTSILADGSVTSAKVNSGGASTGFLLTADGTGGADWAPLSTASFDSRYVLKAGDTMTGALTVQSGPGANVGLTIQGAGVSQTKNLQEWSNGASSVASVNPSGVFSSAGIKFADSTQQITAAFSVPTGYMILGTTTTPPNGYSYTGNFIGTTSKVAWTGKASMPTARAFLGVASANSLIYAIGGTADNTTGLATNESYDPTTDTWTAKAPMPTARLEHVVCALNGKIYAIGGRVNNTTASILAINEVYDPSINSWASEAPMPTARQNSAVAVVNGIIYVIGGDDNSGSLATVEAYDPTSNSWSTKAPMPTARYKLGAAVANNVIYAIGGNSGGGLPTNEAYDPATNTWSTKAPLPSARYGLGAASVSNVIYAFGGYDALNGLNSTNESYNPTADSWTFAAPMIAVRADFGVAVVNNLIYAIGGMSAGPLSTNEVYDPTVNYNPTVYLHMKN
ncbi:MAG TPA: kelch repeat-containing protein [Planctomycetota bacterium]|nr:kelch repeat-containing protein [Planctomycetota bacterium]